MKEYNNVSFSKIPVSNLNMGIDVSRYQVVDIYNVDPMEIADNAALKFVAVRAGVSYGYRDPQFYAIWEKMQAAKAFRIARHPDWDELKVLSYHVIYPSADIDRQYSNYINILVNSGWVGDGFIIDLELSQLTQPEVIWNKTLYYYKLLDSYSPSMPVFVYTRNSFLQSYVVSDQMKMPAGMDKMLFWFAHYGLDGAPRNTYPTVTYPGLRVVIHQFTEKGDAKSYGFNDGNAIDLNRILISKDEFYKLFGNEPVVETPSIETRLSNVELALGKLIVEFNNHKEA